MDDKVPNSSEQQIDAASPVEHRMLEQLNLTAQLQKWEVEQLWGPPDSVVGSGIEHLVYVLDDGSSVGLQFAYSAPYGLTLATITHPGQKEVKILFDIGGRSGDEGN